METQCAIENIKKEKFGYENPSLERAHKVV